MLLMKGHNWKLRLTCEWSSIFIVRLLDWSLALVQNGCAHICDSYALFLDTSRKWRWDQDPVYDQYYSVRASVINVLLFLCPLPSGYGASLPERFQRGGVMRRRRGLIPVQWVRVVSRGPAESVHQHAHQDKTGTPGLEPSGRGTAKTQPPPYSINLPTPPHPAYSCPSRAPSGPQPAPSIPKY